jgi:hypothetical protein
MNLNRFVLFAALSLSAGASAAEPRLSVFADSGVLASPGGAGAALSAGLRYSPWRYVSFGFDLGYGLLDTKVSEQDRWWLVPTVAGVLPLGRVRLELGAGLGLGTASGYPSWSAFRAAPFAPAWAFQLAPLARGHAQVSLAISERVEVFGRLEVGGLLLEGNRIGFRDNNPRPSLAETTWGQLALGAQFGVL